MTITVHHLGVSQSERVVWLLEELGIPYNMVKHTRAPSLSPDSLKNIPGNETGKSPYIEDSDTGVQLSESGAICEYIAKLYGNGKFEVKPSDNAKKFAEYVYWFHYANGSLQPEMVANMFLAHSGAPSDVLIVQFARQRMNAAWKHLDDRLKNNKWLAGEEFTMADIMTLYCPTTQRYWGPQDDLSAYPNLIRWMKDCEARPAYQTAMQKGDPEMKILNDGPPPKIGMMEAGGVVSDHWKK